jgi:signal transduction histidine kinase/ABC-type sugar transport system substrate-binding protein/AraC-like DNA-binding protein
MPKNRYNGFMIRDLLHKSRNPKGYKHRSRIGSLVIPTDPYWVQAVESITATARELEAELIVLQPAASLQELYAVPTDQLVDQISAHNLEAFICTAPPIPVIEALLAKGLPIVCLAELTIDHPSFTRMFSLYRGGKMAGEYIGHRLHGKGHAVCIWAGLEEMITQGKPRLNGFLDALSNYPGISSAAIPAYWSYARSYPVIKKAFRKYPQPINALFGVSDSILLAARDAGKELGILNEDTVLVGLNGDPDVLALIATGEIDATVDIAPEVLGAEAVKIAHQIVHGGKQPRELPQKFELVTQENVASVASHKLAAMASLTNRMVEYNRQQVQDRLNQLEISMEITRQIGSLLDRKQLFAAIHDLVRRYYGFEWMQILRMSDLDHKLYLYEGNPSTASQQITSEKDELIQQVFKTGEAVLIPDCSTSQRWHAGTVWNEIRSRAVLPIQLGVRVIGVLDLQSASPFLEQSLEMIGLELLANQLGIAIQNADLYLEALQAREAAEKANQLKTRLVANVGHEMRTPLNAILGFSQTIQENAASGKNIPAEQLAHDIQRIYTSGEHLMHMINDLLDLSRAEIGALNLYFEAIQPGPFLREIFESFTGSFSFTLASRSVEQNDVHWELDIPDNLPMIRGDVVRLRQILNNLLANAGKFTCQGTIRLGAQVDLPYLHIWVEDSGPGVPIEIQEKIFEPFNTVRTRRRTEGIGLGLSITRHLVNLHDGLLTLESQPGKGSVFHVYLPLPGIVNAALHSTPAECRKLLVISEAAEIPAPVQSLAGRLDLGLAQAANWLELERILAKEAPAAVAWDLAHATPVEWQLVNSLSACAQGSALPLILYHGEILQPGIAEGLTQVVFKPLEGNALENWIVQTDESLIIEHGGTILIVDDDPQARTYYRDILSARYPQHEVICVENGREALNWLAENTPLLIVLDLLMPEVNGFEVLEYVRSQPRSRGVPVVVISGKLLTFDDIQRLNYNRTSLLPKGLLSETETVVFLEQAKTESAPLPQPTSQLVKQCLAYLHQNYSEPLRRKGIAEAIGVSENYLSQIFRQEMTISPWDYLNRYRIQKAKALLLDSPDKVTAIAAKVGFNDSAYFSRVFHKHTGKSPQEFRHT